MRPEAKLRRAERAQNPRRIEKLCPQRVGQGRFGKALKGEVFADDVRKQRRHSVACRKAGHCVVQRRVTIDIPIERERRRQRCNRLSRHTAGDRRQRQDPLLLGVAVEGSPKVRPRALDDILQKTLGVEFADVASGRDRVRHEVREQRPALGVDLAERGKCLGPVRQLLIRLS